MDFTIQPDGISADMTFDKVADIRNNVYLSLNIIRGSWWFNPAFGMRDTRRLKNTERSARQVQSWIKEALQWLLTMGRATSIEVYTQRDIIQDPTRLLAIITVVQANGSPVTFEKFFEVV